MRRKMTGKNPFSTYLSVFSHDLLNEGVLSRLISYTLTFVKRLNFTLERTEILQEQLEQFRVNLLEKIFSQRFSRWDLKLLRQSNKKLNEQKGATVKEFNTGFKDQGRKIFFAKTMLKISGIYSTQNSLISDCSTQNLPITFRK